MNKNASVNGTTIKGVSVPPWKKRRWQMFRNFLAIPEVERATKYFQSVFNFPEYSPLEVTEVMQKYGLPYECYAAYFYLVTDAAASEELLLSHIPSPITWISFMDGLKGDCENKPQQFDASKPEEVLKELSDERAGLHLVIAPNTTAQELRAFIDSFYIKDLKNLSQYFHPAVDNVQPDAFKNSNKRITNREQLNRIEADIYRLSEQEGLPASKIAIYVEEKYDKIMPAYDINTRLRRMRKEKQRHN